MPQNIRHLFPELAGNLHIIPHGWGRNLVWLEIEEVEQQEREYHADPDLYIERAREAGEAGDRWLVQFRKPAFPRAAHGRSSLWSVHKCKELRIIVCRERFVLWNTPVVALARRPLTIDGVTRMVLY